MTVDDRFFARVNYFNCTLSTAFKSDDILSTESSVTHRLPQFSGLNHSFGRPETVSGVSAVKTSSIVIENEI